MEITVEVGTANQKKIIKSELRLIQTIIGGSEPPLNITQVIVPADFDQKVNELQNTDYYKSVRGVVTLAKILEIGDGITMIISPRIYTVDWDTQTRVFIYLHEILHVSNKERIPKPQITSPSLSLYFENIYRLFDEYAADRQALELIDKVFPSKSEQMLRSIDSNVDGFIRIINNQQYCEQIVKEIASFRIFKSDDLILLDNNVLASAEFPRIVEEIKKYGFQKGARFGNAYRYVDFNQGVDARYLTKVRLNFSVSWHSSLYE